MPWAWHRRSGICGGSVQTPMRLCASRAGEVWEGVQSYMQSNLGVGSLLRLARCALPRRRCGSDTSIALAITLACSSPISTGA
jgi:hypothetical protein